MFKFHQQNEIGKRGEELFQKLYPQFRPNNVSDVKAPDFIDDQGRIAEIKLDVSTRARRDKDGHQLNFFMETISNDRRNTPGGLLRAQQEGVHFYVYMFENPQRVFVMDVEKAVAKMQELINTNWYRQCRIKNPNYYTIGYPLPIEMFKDTFVTFN